MTHETHEYLTTPDALCRALSRIGVDVVRVEWRPKDRAEEDWKPTCMKPSDSDGGFDLNIRLNDYRAVLRAPEVGVDVVRPYYVDGIKSDGEYGDGGPDSRSGFDAFGVFDGSDRALFDTLNRDGRTSEINEECDDDRLYAWDEAARRDMELACDALNTHAATGRTASELAAEVGRLNGLLPDVYTLQQEASYYRERCQTFAAEMRRQGYTLANPHEGEVIGRNTRAESAEERVRGLERAAMAVLAAVQPIGECRGEKRFHPSVYALRELIEEKK